MNRKRKVGLFYPKQGFLPKMIFLRFKANFLPCHTEYTKEVPHEGS